MTQRRADSHDDGLIHLRVAYRTGDEPLRPGHQVGIACGAPVTARWTGKHEHVTCPDCSHWAATHPAEANASLRFLNARYHGRKARQKAEKEALRARAAYPDLPTYSGQGDYE